MLNPVIFGWNPSKVQGIRTLFLVEQIPATRFKLTQRAVAKMLLL